MQHILLIEDEKSIADTLIYTLQTEHYKVDHVSTAQDALDKPHSQYALIILDIGLPDMSGFDLCKKMRAFTQIPIIFLTARDSEIDRILGLELGGDDYVTKPFSPREVAARVKAILRRSENTHSVNKDIQETTNAQNSTQKFIHNQNHMNITFQGLPLILTAHEYKLMVALMSQPGRVFSREQLLIKAWDDPGSAMDRTVDAHIKSLRMKINEIRTDATTESPIETRRGLGYSLNPSYV